MNNEEMTMDKVEKALKGFGSYLREFRAARLLSLQEFACNSSISSSYLWRLESNKRIAVLDTQINILLNGCCWTKEEVHLFVDKFIANKEALKKDEE